MNNREAIVLLRNLEDALDSYCGLNEEGKTAFRMAITALNYSESPNSSDTISRQDAIKYFAELWECIEAISDREEWEDVCVTTVNEIKSAEPQKKGKWIFIHPLQADDEGAYICSNCHRGDWDIKPTDKYCKFCGIAMDIYATLLP